MQSRRIRWLGGLGAVVLIGGLALANHGTGVRSAEAARPSGGGSVTVMPLQSWSVVVPAMDRFVILTEFDGDAVLDQETGLVWEKSPVATLVVWGGSRHSCADRVVGNKKAWRLPSFAELASLIDPSVPFPGLSLPPGHPFTNVQPGPYWSASTNAANPANAWFVDFGGGTVTTTAKTSALVAWCVRGGMNADQY